MTNCYIFDLDALDLAIARHLYLNLSVRNPKGYMFIFGEYRGDIVYLIFDEQNRDKVYLIQLAYGTCSVCDPTESILEKNMLELENRLKYIDCFQEDDLFLTYYSLYDVIEKILIPGTYEVSFKEVFKNGSESSWDALEYIKERYEKGLLPLEDTESIRVREIVSYKENKFCKFCYPWGLVIKNIREVAKW